MGMGMAALVVQAFRPSSAFAQGPETNESPPECREAFEQADLELRPGADSHLLRARELLRQCASSSCRSWMIEDCSRTLADVERRIPTVVIAAQTSGHPIVEGCVREGETLLVEHLDGRALEIEPGVHALVLELPSGQKLQSSFVIEEGARLQRLEFEVPPSRHTQQNELVAPVIPPQPPTHVGSPSWLRPAAYIAALSGIATLGVGSGFGIAAWRARDTAHCDARGLCDAEPLQRANDASSVATAGFVTGSVLLGIGLAALAISVWNPSRLEPAR